MSSLRPNFVKRIDRLPKPTNVTMAMQPLFEAISNSIHSVQSHFGEFVGELGKITVIVNTDRKKDDVWATVEDNGAGLDEKNWDAFTTTDTDNKIEIGGKGVGRLLWLDCFESIKVNSVFNDGEKLVRRKFEFVLSSDEQIINESILEERVENHTSCFITFEGLRNNGYSDKFPGRDSFIFQHLTSHFLPTFISEKCPTISVHVKNQIKNYPNAINDIVYRKDSNIKVNLEEFGELSLTLMECDKVASSDLSGSHFVHFIAHDRTVLSQSIDGKLGLKHFGEKSDRVFHAILKGKFLDRNVNQERTNFSFGESVVEDLINKACISKIEDFLVEPLKKLRSEQREKIEEITESYPSVSFGDTDELQNKLPSGELNGDAIYGHLARERFRRDQRQAEQIRSVLARLKGNGPSVETLNDAISEAGKAIEGAEQRSLAEYVVRRKVVLDFIELLLEKVRDSAEDSAYQREDVLHSFICPLRVNTLEDGTHKVYPSTSHDLWIVDERLTFAQYFSSDVEFSVLSEAFQSDERPDVLIFDHVHGLKQTDDSSKVLLIEFKRPGRTSYKDSENPQLQVEGYVRRLASGALTDVRGRPIKLNDRTVFHCFIVADIVGKLNDWTFTWPRTADGRGRMYQPGSGFLGSIHLIGWDALLEDAKSRNQAFFDSAGISGKSYFNQS